MRVFVAGATGAIGGPLVRQLVARGNDVVALARSDANVRTIEALGAAPRRADLFDASSLTQAAEGCDVLVRAATKIPAGAGRFRRRDWVENDRIRIEGTRAMLDAARKLDARFVQESIVWVARPSDGAPFDESSPVAPDEVTRSATEAETMAARSGVPATTLRLGWLYGPETVHTRAFAEMLRKRRLPVIGNGRTPFAFLHVDDAASAFVAAIEQGKAGTFHIVDDGRATTGEFFDDLANVAGGPRPMRVPRWVGALGAGGYVARFLTTPIQTTNAKARAEIQWAPAFPAIREGLAHVRSVWEPRVA